MAKIPSNVLMFATGGTDLYEAAVDYWRHYRAVNFGAKNLVYNSSISLDEKESKLNTGLRKEITRVANMGDLSGIPLEQWANHPVVQWAAFAVVSAVLDSLLPETIIDSIGMYSEVRTGGFGDNFSFEIRPRDLFTTTKFSRGRRVTEVQKQFNGMKTITPEPHAITVGVSLYRVLSGKEDLGNFVNRAVRSMETEMAKDAYNAFYAAFNALPSTASTGLRVSGYTQDDLVDLCQRVTGWNQGQKAVIIGTQRALVNILPTSDVNYRYDVESPFVKVGYLQTAFGYDVVPIPQIMDWTTPFGTLIANNRIWIMSPSAGKPVKVCLEGSTLSNTTGIFDAANLQQTSTLFKNWGVGVVASSVAAQIELA